jgi:hypothetical protein
MAGFHFKDTGFASCRVGETAVPPGVAFDENFWSMQGSRRGKKPLHAANRFLPRPGSYKPRKRLEETP